MSKKSIFYTTADLNYSDVSPTLDLNFVENQKVPPFVNVTRNSQTTYVDKFGILRTADINQPIFEWDPITGKCLGARIWGVATNNLLQSENLSTTWTIFGATVNANIATAPSGTLTADKLEETATTGEHRAGQASTGGATTSAVTFSVFAKAAERTKIRLAFSSLASWSGGGGAAVIFDLTVGSAFADNSTPTAFGIQAYPNGWYRCWITGTPTVSLTPTANAFLFTTSGIYSGTAGSGAFLWGAQLNPGPLAPYVPTTTTTASSTADVWSITGADFGRIWNQSQGTVFINWNLPDVNSTRDDQTLFLADASGLPGVAMRMGYSAGSRRLRYYAQTSAGAFVYAIDGAANTSSVGKTAFAFSSLNDSAASENGAAVLADSIGDFTNQTTTQIVIGSTGSSFANGYIRRLTIYPKRLTNSQLVQLTE